MSIQREASIPADPMRVYELLADAVAVSVLSGKSGTGAVQAGAEFTAFDGHIRGRQIELIPGQRIVQAWRFAAWTPGTYSIVRFTLTPEDGATRIVIDQDGVPTEWHDHVHTNWPTFYLDPLIKHFSAPDVA